LKRSNICSEVKGDLRANRNTLEPIGSYYKTGCPMAYYALIVDMDHSTQPDI